MSDDGVLAAMLSLREDVVWRQGDDAIIVLDARESRYLSIGGSGALLWPLLVAGTTRADLAALLAERFSLEPRRARDDVERFVTGLRDQGLLAS